MSSRNKPSLRNEKGFTLIELITCLAIIGILAAMGTLYLKDLKKRSADAIAYSEGRHLFMAISTAVLGGESFWLGDDISAEVQGAVGDKMKDGVTPRSPLFELSPKLRAKLDGFNDGDADDADIEVRVYHVDGTPLKEYRYYLVEATGEVSVPSAF